MVYPGVTKPFSPADLERRARFWGRLLARFPGVAAIFLSGSLSQGRATASSDIDFFIVAWPGRIFTARIGVLVALLVCGRLAHGDKNHARKICPNHFVTTDYLEFRERGPYYAHLVAHNRLLGGEERVWELFKAANQGWIRDYGCDFQEEVTAEATLAARRRSRFGDLLETAFRRMQRFKHRLHAPRLTEESRVWLTDHEIRLHPNPPKTIIGDLREG